MEALNISILVTHIQKSLHPLKEEAGRWRSIIGPAYEQAEIHESRGIPFYIHTNTGISMM